MKSDEETKKNAVMVKADEPKENQKEAATVKMDIEEEGNKDVPVLVRYLSSFFVYFCFLIYSVCIARFKGAEDGCAAAHGINGVSGAEGSFARDCAANLGKFGEDVREGGQSGPKLHERADSCGVSNRQTDRTRYSGMGGSVHRGGRVPVPGVRASVPGPLRPIQHCRNCILASVRRHPLLLDTGRQSCRAQGPERRTL